MAKKGEFLQFYISSFKHSECSCGRCQHYCTGLEQP